MKARRWVARASGARQFVGEERRRIGDDVENLGLELRAVMARAMEVWMNSCASRIGSPDRHTDADKAWVFMVLVVLKGMGAAYGHSLSVKDAFPFCRTNRYAEKRGASMDRQANGPFSALLWKTREEEREKITFCLHTRRAPSHSAWREEGACRRYVMSPLELIKVTALMERTSGSPEVKIGLIDGPVVAEHTGLACEHVREIPGKNGAACAQPNSTACMHGTFIAGILSGKRNSDAPAICPNCTLLIRPIFAETTSGREHMPSATPLELAVAIIECIDAGARVINLSLALAQPTTKGEEAVEEALNQAVRRGAIVVTAAGNQSTLGGSVITRHPWVIPVVACDLRGRPMNESNLGSSIGRRGLSAPGDNITSLGSEGQSLTFGGTSVAVPFVTGTTALLWSEFPRATAAQIKLAITRTTTLRRVSVVPPLLDATEAYEILSA